MNTPTPSLLRRLAALADPLRARVLLVLEGHELTVSELCAVFQMPQSTMSRHLRTLSDEGWVVSRAEGTSRWYRMPAGRLGEGEAQLWRVVRGEVEALPAAARDAERLRGVLAERRSRSREFFATAAGEWDRTRAELFGRRVDAQALLALLDERWVVADLGCGTGQVAALLAPYVARLIAVDDSAEMLAAARERLAEAESVEVRRGALESLPVADAELDAAVLFLVLHYVPDPPRALAEAARALKPGGRLLVVDMAPHEREEYRQRMGHVWQGFSEDQLAAWTARAGLGSCRYLPLPADPDARGPALFAATARK